MKKKLSAFLFVVSTVLFVVLSALSLEFVVVCKNFQVETSGDFLGAMILIPVFAVTFLTVSALGLGCSIPGAKLASKKAIKICSYIEVAVFSVGTVFSGFQLLLYF